MWVGRGGVRGRRGDDEQKTGLSPTGMVTIDDARVEVKTESLRHPSTPLQITSLQMPCA